MRPMVVTERSVRAFCMAFAVLCLGIPARGQAAELSNTKESGPVQVTTTLAPSEPTIGDEVTLEITVTAAKDVEVLMPEFGEALDRYRILEFVPKQRIEADGSQVSSQKYTLQPVLSGEQSIPPILIEFVDNRPGSKPSPDDFDAYELLTDRIEFSVKSVVVDSASAELKPPLGELTLNADASSSSRWWIVAVALIVVAGILLIAVARRARKSVRRRNAYELARQRLDRLLSDRRSANPTLNVDQFYVEISGVIRRYLEDRFEVRAPELTTDEFLQLAAAESELSQEHQQLLGEFLSQADVVKFAGVTATDAEVNHSCELAVRFLEETRENAPDVDVEAEGATLTREVTSDV
jgi:septum formation topological specificity factor MinE